MSAASVSGAPSNAMTEAPVRLYGGWRLRRGIGLWGLDAASTAVVLGCVLVPLLLAAASARAGLLSALPAAVVAGVAVLRVEGVPLTSYMARRLRWAAATRSGARSRRYGVFAPVDVVRAGSDELRDPARWPPPLSGLELHTVAAARGGDFAAVRDGARQRLTAAVRCAASSAWLVDREDADGWVGAWHSWLASLGYLPAVRWVAVVVETAPEPGTALRDAVHARTDPSAPSDARALLRNLVARAPAATAHVTTWVAVTCDVDLLIGAERRSDASGVAAAAAELDRLMAGLEASLGACGVTVMGRATCEQLLDVVADAYDPASRGRRPAPTRRSRSGWSDSGPLAVEEDWDRIRHDSGTSVSWGWQEAPRQHVTSDVLSRLHSPGRHPKRVTLLYRPMPAADAARLLESEVNAAAFRDAMRRAQRRDETARDVADREQARRAAREEAMGAGVVLVSIYVTTTVTDPAALPDAVADVEARADQAKIRLRRLYGGQALGLATTLPLGVHPAAWAGPVRGHHGRRGRRGRR